MKVFKMFRFILILCMMPSMCFAQKEWKRVFFDEHDAPPVFNSPIEFYDKGYLVGGWITQSGGIGIKGWLVKTDINGYELWTKLFENQGLELGFLKIQQNVNGEIFVAGALQYPGMYATDPFIMKLKYLRRGGMVPGIT
jgi:hypothetical protein